MKKKISILITIFMIISFSIIFKENIYNFVSDGFSSFYRTVVEENRYILLLNGLGNTMIISLFSIIIGSIVGFPICFFRLSKNKIVNNLTKIIINIIQGTPITVLLLIFYYVLFANVNLNPNIIAIITFSLYFAIYVAEIYRGAFNSINKSQIAAAYSLGFNKSQAFRYIIFPQALVYTIPVYKNEIVSLIKLTSIAGYISVMDLTKASDIIRNRTYEAFFPLIITAIIYFVICYLIGKILDLIYKKVNPRKYRRNV